MGPYCPRVDPRLPAQCPPAADQGHPRHRHPRRLPADRARSRVGDIIVRVDEKPITSIEDLNDAVEKWQKDPGLVGVDVLRDRGQIPLVVKP